MIYLSQEDLQLYAPIASTVNLEPMRLASDDPAQANIIGVDRAKATHIADTMLRANREWKEHLRTSNRMSMGSTGSYKPLLSPWKGGNRVATSDDFQNGDSQKAAGGFSSEELAQFKRRRPKAIVFSQHETDLQVCGLKL